MASNEYDFYITSEDHEWESRILKKLQAKGYRGYHRQKFTLGGLKSTSRLHGVKNSKVKIIGFVSPRKQKTDTENYIATLALEYMNQESRVICVRISKDSVIPAEYSALVAFDGWDEDLLCTQICDSINSLSPHGSAGDAVDSTTNNDLHLQRTEQDFGLITDLRIAELSKSLGDDWSMLATYLGISLAQQQDLRRDYRISRERNEQMLVMWRGRGAGTQSEKLASLVRACEKCKRCDLKDEITQWK